MNRLGYLDAEHAYEKQHFSDFFIHTKSVSEATDDGIAFVCGRRGSGKSAIANMLGSMLSADGKRKYDVHIAMSRSDYESTQVQLCDDLTTTLRHASPINVEIYYYHIWNYILRISVIIGCVKITQALPPLQQEEKYRSITEYVKSFYAGADSCPAEEALDKARICLEAVAGSRSPTVGFSAELTRCFNDDRHRDAYNLARSFFRDYRGILSIDTIEQYSVTHPYLAAWKGMCRAVKDFHISQKGENFFLKCFLPAELTTLLFAENLAKYNEISVYLRWSYAELIEFISRRYANFLKNAECPEHLHITETIDSYRKNMCDKSKAKEILKEELWHTYFPRFVRNIYGWEEDSAAYIIRHTQKRPREILSCMNHIVEEAIENRTIPKVSEKSVYDGIHHPRNLHQLLTDSVSIFYAIYGSIGEGGSISDLARVMFSNETTIFTEAKLRQFAKRAFSVLYGVSMAASVADRDAVDMVIRSGLVGVVVDPESSERNILSNRNFKYYYTKFEYCVPDRIVLNDKSLCAVHPMLGDPLRLKDPKNGVVYPLPEPQDVSLGLLRETDFE
ncbi:MAG: hypothetical protein AB7N91_31340 [Candidatus Tectimicrobiota bacterium]